MADATGVLIVDDEADVCNFLRRLLTRKGYAVSTATNEAETLSALREGAFQVAMVDLKLPDTDGLSLLRQIKARQPACEVIIMTGFSTIKTAVSAMQMGAYEYVEKPFDDIAEIEQLIHKAASHGRRVADGAGDEDWAEIARAVGFQVGRSAVMRRLLSLAYKVAGKNINVLIQGKTGCGKEVLARFIHAASTRADQAFFPINCAALPENMLESELFGHERGSFTGAAGLRRGIFELAHRGTLFLDEIGDASPAIQVKLLRVLESGEFMRVGGEKPVRSNVRLISASNVDLEEAVRGKSFREDLFYRLNVVRLELPSLAERREDIPDLAEFFLQQNHPGLALSPAVLAQLQAHAWPGNIRELINVLRRAAALCGGTTILPQHLGRLLPLAEGGAAGPVGVVADPPKDLSGWFGGREELARWSPENLAELLGRVEEFAALLRQLTGRPESDATRHRDLQATEIAALRAALDLSRWNISAAARQLGIGRNTLHRKINKYGLRKGS
ncbi:sigma-54-dependent transcriptional regulator [Geoalkalibacter sp.]|uniref:sigma-54-dependent transcriptional regulator n=1 Tax=Geoalkalibacter sp. TaxID=3041440 RepID=UPI00272E51F1|nr:sigma-54 dependent transcriptional regulator [Geoalkalibacter sp.]